MRILIADDEKLVRYSLRSMLEEIGLRSRSITVAANGEEMLEEVRRASPDMAFVDIRMPRCDGLAAIEQARALSPGTRWVILTSHSSFDYARRALQLGATEYLLKPVSPAELERVVGRVAAELRQDLLRQNEEFEGRLVSLIHGTLSLESEAVDFVSSARYLAALLLFDSALKEEALVAKQRACCREIRSRIPAALEKGTRIALCTLPVGYLALVCAWLPGAGEAETVASLRAFLRRLQAVLGSGGAGTRVTEILTEECGAFPELLQALQRSSELAELRVVAGTGRQIEAGELARESGRFGPLCREVVSLVQAYRGRSRLDFMSSLERAQRLFDSLDRPAREAARPSVEGYLTATLALRPGAVPPGASWSAALREIGESLHGEDGAPRAGELADQVESYVDANYMRDIGIGQIADHLGVTPNYLSTLFHREKGITFVKYLTRLRMEKARELLAEPGRLVQDVARSVGYGSPRHFSKLFQKQFGSYPSDLPRGEKSTLES